MFALCIPWFIFLVLSFSCFFLYLKKWRYALFFILIGLTANWIFNVYPLNLFSDNIVKDGFKVMAWNINGTSSSFRNDIYSIVNTIEKEDADMVFVAEDYYDCCEPLDSLLKSYYPYTTHTACNDGHYFYSKYPLGRHKRIAIDVDHRSCIIKSSVIIDGITICLFGCHLSSNNYFPNDTARTDKIDDMSGWLSYFKSIISASDVRSKQSAIIVDNIKKSGPVLILGDMNDVCGSKPLNILKGDGFTDAWSHSGVGYGATIHHPLPYRIDHIMYNDGLILKSIKKVDAKELSDHDALTAVFEIKQP